VVVVVVILVLGRLEACLKPYFQVFIVLSSAGEAYPAVGTRVRECECRVEVKKGGLTKVR